MVTEVWHYNWKVTLSVLEMRYQIDIECKLRGGAKTKFALNVKILKHNMLTCHLSQTKIDPKKKIILLRVFFCLLFPFLSSLLTYPLPVAIDNWCGARATKGDSVDLDFSLPSWLVRSTILLLLLVTLIFVPIKFDVFSFHAFSVFQFWLIAYGCCWLALHHLFYQLEC